MYYWYLDTWPVHDFVADTERNLNDMSYLVV